MTPDLPPWLRAAIENEIAGQGTSALVKASARISETYRGLKPSRQAILHRADVGAYLTARMPATYAAISAALSHVSERLPDFTPRTLLDIGAGPGTASFAAVEQMPSLEQVMMVDDNAPFLEIARKLVLESPVQALRQAQILSADISKNAPQPATDLIIAAYSLVELPVAVQTKLLISLWQVCTGVLLIVEPGTPAAHARLMQLRHLLIGEGAYIVAPCPGHGDCPLVAPDWCHFSQRLPRSKAHMAVKGADLSFEDEKYSYLAVSRIEAREHIARILDRPKDNKIGIEFKLCTKTGLQQKRTPVRDKPSYKKDRKLVWGDAMEFDV